MMTIFSDSFQRSFIIELNCYHNFGIEYSSLISSVFTNLKFFISLVRRETNDKHTHAYSNRRSESKKHDKVRRRKRNVPR